MSVPEVVTDMDVHCPVCGRFLGEAISAPVGLVWRVPCTRCRSQVLVRVLECGECEPTIHTMAAECVVKLARMAYKRSC